MPVGESRSSAVPRGVPGPGTLPVLPALRELLPRGGLARGSVLAVAEFGLLCLALVAGASADGAWCGIAGIPEAGVLAATGLGLDAGRTLLVPEPGPAWPQVVASLLDGCEIVLLRPPVRAPAQVQAAPRGDAAARAGRPAGGRGLARGAGAAAGRHPAVDRAGGRVRAAAGVLRGGGGGRPRGGGYDAYALALAARRERRRRRGRPAGPPGGLPVRPPSRPALHRDRARPAGGEPDERPPARRPPARCPRALPTSRRRGSWS